MGAGSLIIVRMPCSFNICKRGGTIEEKRIVGDNCGTQDLVELIKKDPVRSGGWNDRGDGFI